MTTPFIDSLSQADRERVTANTRGDQRPSYHSATLASAQANVQARDKDEGVPKSASVQISLDFEAFLILMSPQQRGQMMDFIRTSVSIMSSSEELALMTEVAAVRAEGYAQVVTDAAGPTQAFDVGRASVLEFLASKGADSDSQGEVLIPDLSSFFSAVSVDYLTMTKPDILAMHDRIVDSSVLGAYTDIGSERTKELLSWLNVFQTYQSIR